MPTWEFAWGVDSVLRNLVRLYLGRHFKTKHPGITRDDHYGPSLDLADVKLEEVDVIDISKKFPFVLPSLPVTCFTIISFCDEFPVYEFIIFLTNYYESWSIQIPTFLMYPLFLKTNGYMSTQEIVCSSSVFYHLPSYVTLVLFIKDK